MGNINNSPVDGFGGVTQLFAGRNVDQTVPTAGPTGTIDLPSGTFSTANSVGSFSYAGGTIVIAGGSIRVNGAGASVLSANGANGGNGGTVYVRAVDTNADLVIGTSAGQLNLQALSGTSSGNGGFITVEAGRNLSIVNTLGIGAYSRGTSGNGGRYDLTAGLNGVLNNTTAVGTLTINSSLDANASAGGVGNGGQLNLKSASTQQFVVGGSVGCTNCVAGSLLAKGGFSSGAGGSISIVNYGGLLISNVSNLNVSPTKGNGGSLNFFLGPGALTINGVGASLAVDAKGAGNFNGGQIQIMTLTTLNASKLNLSANATGTGNGGAITIEVDDGSINLSATGNIASISAKGGSAGSAGGNGGILQISAKDIYINPSLMNLRPQGTSGNGSTLSLLAFYSLAVDGSLDANGVGVGTGGGIQVGSGRRVTYLNGNRPFVGASYTTPVPQAIGQFSIGGVLGCSNCIAGGLSANAGATSGSGGIIQVIGDNDLLIKATAAISALASAGGGQGGVFRFQSDKVLTIEGRKVDADAKGAGTFAGGIISLVGRQRIDVTGTSALVLTAKGTATGAGGSIGATTESLAGNLTLGTGIGMITATATGGAVGSASGDGGYLEFRSGGDLTIASNSAVAQALGNSGKGARYDLRAAGVLTIDGNVDARGRGLGSGGSIILSAGTGNFVVASPTACSGCFSGLALADGGISGVNRGTPGSISITNLSGDISVNNWSGVSLTGAGQGGSLTLSAVNGSLSVPGGTYSLGGTGTANGGIISFVSATFSAAAQLLLSANGPGNGGSITVQTSSLTQDITIGTGKQQLSFSATGGPAGSSSGNGGSVTVGAGRDLIVSPAAINVQPLGTNGNGGVVTLVAGRHLIINGSLSANGAGTGNGGTLTLAYATSMPSFPYFFVGLPVTGSGVTGNLSATAPGAGTGGNINIETGPGRVLNVINASKISAKSTSGAAGNVSLLGFNGSTLPAVSFDGGGLLEGTLNAKGGTVFIAQSASNNLVIGNVTSTAGPLSITSARITLASPTSLISATGGSANIFTTNILNNGIIKAAAPNSILLFSGGNLTVTGTGVLVGSVIVSSAGAASINQGGLVGTISGSAAGGLTIALGTTLGTNGTLSQNNIGSFAGNGQFVFNTASQTIHVSLGEQNQFFQPLAMQVNQKQFPDQEDSDASVSGDVVYVVNSNQALTGFVASSNTLTFADEETMVSNDGGVAVLHKGRVVVDTGENETHISTPAGSVCVHPNSTMIVDARVPGRLTALMLGGSGSLNVEGQKVPLGTGEELLAGSELSDDEMVPVDGIARGESISAGITKTTAVVKRKIQLKQVVERDIMIAGSLVHVSGAGHKSQSRYTMRVKAAADSQSPFDPIAYTTTVHHSSAQQKANARNTGGPSLHGSMNMLAEYNSRVHITAKGRVIDMRSGGVFFQAPDNMLIRTSLATIDAQKNACIAIESRSDTVKIKVCSGINSAKVRVGISSVNLSAGEELIVSKNKLTSSKLASLDRIGRRSIVTYPVGSLHVARSEFAIMSLVATNPHLNRLAQPDSASMRHLQANILKSAAALQFVTGSRGAYKSSQSTSMR